ncbi:MAG: hypothetical protein NPIRA03_25530 [Nitrospirales bacterium]|nr:MAG: hypothetical protein NPIRA03_25530 [Nitrospirales bacterium]
MRMVMFLFIMAVGVPAFAMAEESDLQPFSCDELTDALERIECKIDQITPMKFSCIEGPQCSNYCKSALERCANGCLSDPKCKKKCTKKYNKCLTCCTGQGTMKETPCSEKMKS